MCVCCRSPMATAVTPLLPSSRKAASLGRESWLHVPHSLHLHPAEYCWHQGHSLASLKRVFHLVEYNLPIPALAGFTEQGKPASPWLRLMQHFAQEDEVHQAAAATFSSLSRACPPRLDGESQEQSRVWKCQGLPSCCGCPEHAGAGFWQRVRAVVLAASGGTAFPLAGFCCGWLGCPGLEECSEVHTPRFDLHCFNHPKHASPVHMQILSKSQTVSSFCISFNSFIFFFIWQLLHLRSIRNNFLALSWPFCFFFCVYGFR